ncbi:Lateral signaling target protein [Trichinella spiralis]|uniref:Lateral signaling target protein n=1 Tax=Trichinella spiralis TaxID=6334 RepID=A0ABR3K4K0_TRISP
MAVLFDYQNPPSTVIWNRICCAIGCVDDQYFIQQPAGNRIFFNLATGFKCCLVPTKTTDALAPFLQRKISQPKH